MIRQHDAPGEKFRNPPSPTSNPGSDLGDVVVAGRRYLRLERLAALLAVSPRTLARWDAQRIGPPKTKIGKLILFDADKLGDWLARFETAPVRSPRRRSV